MPRKKKQIESVTLDTSLMSPTVTTETPAIPPITVRDRDMSAREIIERRLALGDKAVKRKIGAKLKKGGEPMTLRPINTQMEGRFGEVVDLGWEPVPYERLENARQSGWKKSEEGYACRGEKGAEILMMMPTRYYTAIQAKKAADERHDMRSAKLLKERTQESLAKDGMHRTADRFGKLHVDEYEESVEHHTFERA